MVTNDTGDRIPETGEDLCAHDAAFSLRCGKSKCPDCGARITRFAADHPMRKERKILAIIERTISSSGSPPLLSGIRYLVSAIVGILSAFILHPSSFAAPEPLQRDTKTKELVQTELNLKSVTFTIGNVTISDAAGIRTFDFGPTNGTKLGATGNKIGFFGATPIVKPTGNILTALTNLGLVTSPTLAEANITGLTTTLGTKQPLDTDLTNIAALITTSFGRDFLVIANATAAQAKLELAAVAATGDYDDLTDLPSLPDDTPEVATFFLTGYDPNTGEFFTAKPNFTDLAGTAIPGQIPNLDAAKIATGAFDKARQHAATAYEDEANVFTANQDFISHTTGSVTMRSLATPGAPTVGHTGVAGASTWSYRIVAKLPDGTVTVGGTTGSTTSGNATLDTNNFNTLSWTAVAGASAYDVYRTAVGLSPATLGKIATVAGTSYNDQGAAGDSAAVPSTNTTGRVGWLADGVSDIGDASASRPRDVNAARNINAGEAITAATSAISGNSTVGGTTNNTGPITGPIRDKGGQVYNVIAYGATGDGVTDDWAASQAAADAIPVTGGTLYFPKAAGFRHSRVVLIKAGTRILGEGTAGPIVPFPDGSFVPHNMPIFGGNIFTLFANVNFGAGSITDTDITYENLALGPVNGVHFSGFGITTRQAQNVQVINCTGQFMNELAIMVASKDTLFDRCTVRDMAIAAFDHWEGADHATVRDCTVYDSPHAVLFNSEATLGTAAFVSSNLRVTGGKFVRCSSGAIFVAPLNASEGSTLHTVKIRDNYIDQDGNPWPGIAVHSSSDIDIGGNTIENVVGAANCITIGAESASFPSDKFDLRGNTLRNCAIGGFTYLSALGTNGQISGNKAENSTAFGGIAIHRDSPTTLVLTNDLSGATTELLDATNLGVPTTPGLRLKANTATQTFEVTGNFSATGNVSGANVVPGHIDRQTLASPGGFTFNNIPSTYSRLEITISGRGTESATNVGVTMTFNNDTGANYEWVEFSGVTQTAQTSLRIGVVTGGTSPGNYPGSIAVTVPAYSGSTFYKACMSLNVYSPTAGTLTPLNEFGVYKSTSPISRVDVGTASGGFATGSTATLIAR